MEFDKVKYNGTDVIFNTGAKREAKEKKGRFDLLPPRAILRLAKHFENGAQHHGDRNWEKGIPLHSYLDSALRHLINFMMGLTDEDHLSASIWNLTCLIETIERIEAGQLPKELNDLPWNRINKSLDREKITHEQVMLKDPGFSTVQGKLC